MPNTMRMTAGRLLPALVAAALAALPAYGADEQAKPGMATCLSVPGAIPGPKCKPTFDKLNALLDAKDWGGLVRALSFGSDGEENMALLDWQQDAITSGRGGLLVSLAYARNLWLVGSSQNAEDPARDLRMSSAMITLYAFILIRVDGLECQDSTSPSHRMDQLVQQQKDVLLFLASKPKEARDHVISNAVAMEKLLAPHREHNDELLCNGGMLAMMAGLMGGQQREVPTPPGHVGKTTDVVPPAGWKPAFLAPEVYEPAKAKARDDLQKTVEAFVDVMVKAAAPVN